MRNTAKGSWYIQSVCNVMNSHRLLHKIDTNLTEESIDLLSLMTEITYDMILRCDNGFAQTPSYISFLSKPLYVRYVCIVLYFILILAVLKIDEMQ
jgi:hypothetical protein